MQGARGHGVAWQWAWRWTAAAIGSLAMLAAPSIVAAAPPLAIPRAPVTIVGGEPTEANEYPTVVGIAAAGGLCTGTLVTETLVLTAGHCLANLDASTPVTVYYGNVIRADQAVAAERFGAHPEFCATCDEDIYDYGYIVTAAKFNPPYARPILTQQEWDETMALGAEVTLVGFGKDPDAKGDEGLGVKRKVTTAISRFSAGGLEFYAGGDRRDSCEGDSGGPAFVTLPDGSTRLAGITSRGSDPCGDGGFYSSPYPSLCWVREQTGIDLLEGDCSACDCLDITPPATDEEGCRVGPRGDRAPVGTALLLGLVALRRRRPSPGA